MAQDLKSRDTCEECGSFTFLDKKTGSEVCRNCGLVLNTKLFNASENFFDVYYHNRTVNGFPASNTINDPNLLRQFNFINLQEVWFKNKLARLIKLQNQSNFGKGKSPNFVKGLQELDRVCANLDLGHEIQEEAAFLFRKAEKLNLTKGRATEKVCICCVYLALKARKLQYPFDQLIKLSDDYTKKELLKLSTFLADKLNVQVNNNKPNSYYLLQILNNGNFSDDLLGIAITILDDKKTKIMFQGKSPKSIAAAAIYLAAKKRKKRISQEDVARAAKVSRKTVSIRIKELKQIL